MWRLLFVPLLVLAVPAAPAEPAPRKPAPVPLKIAPAPKHVSAVFELPDGRMVISDAKTPAVSLVEPGSGQATPLGSVGAGPDQYVQPGGLYADTGGGALLLDRAQLLVTAITPSGALGRTYSIAVKGVTGSSSADIDQQRLDHRGFSYFVERSFATPAGVSRPSWPLLRFDPIKQLKTKVADLRQGETTTVVDGNMSFSRGVVGSPADGFGVAPDGRIAIVRGEPYRVEWIGVDGAVTRGPEIAIDPIPITEADRAAHKASMGRGGSVSVTGGGGAMPEIETRYAATKAPFSPTDIVVSPDAQVWVMRARAATSTEVVYDVFDRRGQRVDRLVFPDGSTVVGFGAAAVYVRETGAGGVTLKKYRVR